MEIKSSDLVCRDYRDNECIAFSYYLKVNNESMGYRTKIDFSQIVGSLWFVSLYIGRVGLWCSCQFEINKENSSITKIANKGLQYIKRQISNYSWELKGIEMSIEDIIEGE